MAEGEKVDLLKAVKSVATPIYWTKVLMYCFGAICLFFLGNAIYKTYFKKPVPTQTFEHVNKVVYEANKRKFILFAEPFVQIDTHTEAQHGSIGIRVGCRTEF